MGSIWDLFGIYAFPIFVILRLASPGERRRACEIARCCHRPFCHSCSPLTNVERYRHVAFPIMMETGVNKGFVKASMDASRPSTGILRYMFPYVLLCSHIPDTTRRRADLHNPYPPRVEHIPAVNADVRRCTAMVLIRCIVIHKNNAGHGQRIW